MTKLVPVLMLFVICSIHAQNTESMLIGKISSFHLKEAPYAEWFVEGYDAYAINDAVNDDLRAFLKGVHIKTFMGTWCSDSQKQVPHFYKILDELSFPIEDSELIAMDLEKVTPDQLEDGLNIQRVPTFIIYRDKKEIGRIVEYPIVSLEEDLLAILSGKDYKHAYAQ